MIAQSLALSLVGERLIIMIGAVMLLYALARVGISFGRRQVMVGITLLVLFAWAITAARGAEGRYTGNSGASVRFSFVTTGFTHLFAGSTAQEISYSLGYRLDGNSYGAMSLESLDNGSSPVGITPLKNDFLLAIPSFLYPQKDQSNYTDRSDKLYVEEYLPIWQLQTGYGTYYDIVPTQLGGLTGILGPAGMLVAAFLLGLGFAALDRWLARSGGPVRMLMALGALYAVLDYEGSWDTYTTTARGIFLLAVLMASVLLVRYSARRTILSLGANTYSGLGGYGSRSQ